MKPFTLTLLAAILMIIGCRSNDASNDTTDTDEVVLGQLEHGFQLNERTQEKFDEGLLLLHNFEYDDALVAFEEATALDSTEILTHWGEAMCHYKALWRLQNTEKGRAIVERLGDTKEARLASITDPIEQVMWELVEIMYGEGEFDSRNQKIKAHLSASHATYPQHQEIAAFYALSLIWATDEYGDGSDDLRLAAAITDQITATNPLHPGALHYKIHALDGPVSAQDALDAADAYAKVAADAAHALHMPSHIYLATGAWDGVVQSNRESYDASVARMIDLDLKDGARGYHSLAWLHYGLLQKGQYGEAEQVLREILTHVPKDPTKGARRYLLGMQTRQLAESGAVSDDIALDLDVKVSDIGLLAQSARSFLRAQVAYEVQDIDAMQAEIQWLSDKIYIAGEEKEVGGLAMCAAGTSRYAPTDNAIMSGKVVKHQIQAMIALVKNDEALFESHMKQAVALEDETNYPAGPPRIALPSFEQYGAWLLEKENYAVAVEQYDKALARMPRRAKSLMGKMAALKALNQKQQAQKVADELDDVLAQADEEVLSGVMD